jgi:undecaprenyl-diphosphatase
VVSSLFSILRRLTSRHLLLMAATLVIVSGIWGLIELTDRVVDGDTKRFDNRVIVWCWQHQGPPWLQDCARDLTALGGDTVLPLVVLAVVGFLLISGKRGAALLVIVAVGGGVVISSLIKHFVGRARPPREYQGAYVFTASFPSGHSMLSAVTYLTLGALLAQISRGRLLRLYIVSFALLVTFLVGLSRVYLRVHWPTDVLAGWVAGLLWSILCLMIARELQRRGEVEDDLGSGT